MTKVQIDLLLNAAESAWDESDALTAIRRVGVIDAGMRQVVRESTKPLLRAGSDYIEADRALFADLAPKIERYVSADRSLDNDEKQAERDSLELWKRRIDTAGEVVTEIKAKTLGKIDVPKDVSNVEMHTLRTLKPIPTWNLEIAAGGWVSVPINGELDLDDPLQRAVLEQGLFRICIAGDSMVSDWLPGDCVEFEMHRPDRDVLTIGEDYLCIRSDSVGTFKRLEKFDDDTLFFRAVNRKKYPALMKVARQDVARMARALHVVIDRRRK